MVAWFAFFLQGFSHLQSEYQKSIGGSQSPGAPGPGPGPGVPQSHDWDSEYCNRECGNHCRSVETEEAGLFASKSLFPTITFATATRQFIVLNDIWNGDK